MTVSLRPTAARLALLQAVEAGEVRWFPAAMGSPAEYRHGRHTVTAAMDAMRSAGWLRLGTPEHASMYARRPVELTAAGRRILDQHRET